MRPALVIVLAALTVAWPTPVAASARVVLRNAATCSEAPLLGLCVGRPATAQEEGAMIAVGKPGIEQELGLSDSCSATTSCFQVGSPSRAMVGTDAGTFYGIEIDTTGKTGCYVFLYRDSGGWHYANGRCITATNEVPAAMDAVYVDSGCANVRDQPSLTGNVVACLPSHVQVHIDAAPVYAAGHVWWHLACQGWMAHDFLVIPLHTTTYPPVKYASGPCQGPTPPFSPMVSFSLDSGPLHSRLVMIGTGFPPGEEVDLYWDTPRNFPGPLADEQGDFQDDNEPTGWSGWMPSQGTTQLCGDTGPASGITQQYVAKACSIPYVIEGTPQPVPAPPPAASPTVSAPPITASPTVSAAPLSASPTAITVRTVGSQNSMPAVMLVLLSLGVLLVAFSGGAVIFGRGRR